MELVLLEPAATLGEVEKVCKQAIADNCTRLTLPPLLIKKAKEHLSATDIQLSVPIGFPYGWNAIEAKLSEIILSMVDGADELDLHINLTAIKNNDWQYLAKELNMALTVIRRQQKKINIVAETSLLTEDELTKCCDLYGAAGVDCFTVNSGLHKFPGENVFRSIRAQLADSIPLRVIIAEKKEFSAFAGRHALIVK